MYFFSLKPIHLPPHSLHSSLIFLPMFCILCIYDDLNVIKKHYHFLYSIYNTLNLIV